MTIDQAGERLMELDRENNTGFFDQNDPNAGTNAILDALSDNDTIGQLRSYVARQRKAEAEREANAAYSSMNAYYEQTFGEKLEDTALYDEIRSAEILASGLSESEQQELNNIIFAEEISQYGTEGYQTEASGVYESEVAGNATNVEPGAEGIRTESVGVLQGAQSDNSGRDAEPEEGQRGSEGESSEQDALPSVPSGESATAVESSLDEDMPDFSNQIEQVREEVDADPSEAQKKAGNYKMGHLHLDGYNITIENPKGSVRRGTDSKGNEWENTLNNDYGYIRGTEGVDGDHIDVYLSDNPAEGNVFVIDQVNPETREFDEHKVMYGFNSMDEAREAYLANFSEGWNGLGTITEVTKDEFRKWIDSSHRKTKPFSEYKSVKPESAQSSKAQLSDEEVTRKAVEFFTPDSKALALRERIDSWVSKLGVKVNVMESIDDVKNAQAKALIKKGSKVWGWFESEAGEVYIYLPDFASLDLEAGLSEIDKTYIHEIVAHQGLRGLLGQEKYDELCDKLWESLSEEEKKDALARSGVNRDERKAADEHIAYYAETINYESNPSAWDKIVSIVKDILRSLGLNVNLTDDDLAALLRASYQKLATEAQTKPEKKSESKPKKTSKVKAEKAADEKIEDFGEKIGGARKDVARAKIRDSVKLSQKDLIELKDPDKILSRKNIIKYYADGTMTYEDAVKLLAMNMAVRGRDAIDRGVAMKKYRSLALAWESGAELVVNITDEDVQDRMNEFSERMRQAPDFEARTRASLEQFVLKVYNDYKRTYEALEYPEVYRNLKSAYIRYGDHDGKYWVVGGPSSYRGWPFPTLEQAVAKIEKIYPVEAVAKKPSESKNEGEKSSSILVTKDRAGYYRIKSRNIPGEIYLSGKMYSKKDAETFLAENYDKLVERENKLTEALLGSNIGMVEREGIDYRKGKDVTPKDFLDTFGFRGVEFGNWVPQVERQAYLNKTYDAIMDFCHIVGISPKAFSLGGRLGLAFGARGKSRALAHYEPLKEVINLTRMKGAGSLAHEWFHALDNYLAKQKSGNVSDMATDKKPAVRQEVTDALNAFVAAMNRLEYTRRSNRAGQYWGEVWERAARLFESYIYNELGGQNTVSPLLVKKDTLYVDQGEYSDDAWPYPSAEENVQMKPFFDNIFATLQEQVEKDGSVTLFRAEEVGRKQAQLDVINETNPMTDGYHVGIRNVEDIKTFDEVMEEARRESEKGGWSELASYPDISNDMLEDALETRRIVIYSSHPIANGVFVTPSYMQADEYSGMTGEVYSKDVSVDDIAWINTDEGQFASLNDAIQKYDGTPDNETSFRGVTPAMDAEYIAAVNRGDMETAQRMVNRAARMAGYDSSSEYQGSIAFNGAAPSSNPYYESKEERKEAWENGDYEGEMSLGDYVDFGIDTHDIEWQLTHPNALRSASASGRTSILNLRNAVNSKDRKIKIYRAIDANIKEGSIRNGDWVTPSRSYAQEHIYMQNWKKGRIIEQEVSIDDLWWDGNDINEWGYDDGKGYAYKDTKNNRKLLNAVTYDDNGNVIPLSKRFNPRKEDVRFRATEITPEVRDEMDRIAATAIIDGNYMLAPNGQSTKLTADQWAMVRTENFKRWFGDWINDPENASKVVDENGEPMVVYHGTSWNPLEEPSGGAVFKSGWYAGIKSRAEGFGEPVAVFLNIKNPAYSYDKNKENDSILPDDFDLNHTSTFGQYDGYISYIDYPEVPRISEIAKRRIMIMNPENYEEVINQTLAEMPRGRQIFSAIPKGPSQIKSATDNTGEFSAEEDDIRFRAEEPRTAPSKDEVPEIIDDLFEQADSSKNKVQRKIISSVTPRQLEEYRKKGILNVTADFVHSIENTALRHENKRHSGDNRTQQPLTKEEWHNILDVIENFDTVEKQKSRSGLDVIVYKKKNNDGTIYYVEEIRTGRKSLALTTAYKKRGDSSELMADALPQTSETTLDNTSFDGKDSDYLDNNNSYNTDDRFRTTTGTPTEDIVENGLQLSVQNYARLAGDIFAALPENMRREVVEDTFRNGIDMQRAIMQIPTRLAEKDDLSEVEVEVAKMIAGKVQDALLADGVLMTRPLTTAEAIWMLYKHNNAGNDILSAARRSVVADNLGFSNGIIGGRFSNEDDIRFRASRAARADSAARMYNTEARLAWRRLQESWQDMNVSVDSLMRALETASGKAIQAFENIAMALNRLSSKNLADKKKFLRDKLMPLWEKVLEISDKFKVSIEDIERYMMLKHGLERNLVLAARDARNYYKEELEKELSRIDKDSSLSKSEKKAAKAKAEATYQRHLKNIENGTDSEYLENRKKDYGGLTSLYSDYADYGTREDYDTEEEYQEAAKAARTPKYKTLEEAENAAVAEVGSFEAKIGGLTMELWHKVNAATKDTLKHQYNHGMLTKEQYESVRDMFEYYVPLRGFKDNTVEDMYSYYGSGQHNDFAKPLQAAKGRRTEAESPLGWIGSMAESAIQMDNKNDAKLRLYYLAVNRPDNDLMKITETWYEWTGDYNAEGKKIFEPVYPTFSGHLSGDSMQAKMDAFDSMMEQQAMQGNAFRGKQRIDIKGSIIRMPKTEPEHVVNVKVAGKDYSILINGNPRAAQAINGLLNIDNADANGVYRGFRAVLRMMSALSTSYNPEFWISNFQRDMMYAFIGTSIRHDKAYTAEFAKNYIEAFKVISMLRKNKKGALGTSETESYYKEFSENGGVTGYTVLVNNAEYDKMLREFQKDQQKSDFIKKVKSGFEAVADFGEAIEQVSRFAAYMTSRKMGKGIEESVNEAKEITVNFNRKGSGKAISWEEAGQLRNRNGKPLNWAEKVFFVTASGLSPIGRSVYMFFNASIQGLSAAAKLARNNPKKSAVWAGIFLSMGMLNAVLHAMLDDDDDYLDMPEYEKRTNLLIGGNGVYFKWALPQEVRPFYAMADIFVNHAMGRAPHKNIIEELASVFADLLPVNTVGAEGLEGVTGALMPSYVSPIYQVIINKDFKGAPIYREMPWIPDDQQKDVPAYTKAYSGTGSLYVNVSEMLNNLSGGDYSKAGAININPAVVEHIVEGYGGGTLTTANKVLKSLGMIAGTEDISFRSMPFLSRILTVNDDRYRNAHTTELYNYYKGISDQAKRSYNAYEKQRDGDKLSELMRSEDWKVHQIFLRYKKMLDYYDKQLKLASTEDERRTIMREQDAQRKRVIEEISRLR